MGIIKQAVDNYVFAVVRGKTAEDALEICRAAVKGGIKNLEVTYSTPDCNSVIRQLVDEYKEDSTVVVGAGTVMNLDLAKQAVDAGATFLVSPHFDREVAAYAVEVDVPYMPGCATATEIVNASRAGSEIVKLFPGGSLGPSYIKDIHGPCPELKLMPSGGVSIDNVKDWIEAGAIAVGMGSALSARVATDGYESVTEIAENFMKVVAAHKK